MAHDGRPDMIESILKEHLASEWDEKTVVSSILDLNL